MKLHGDIIEMQVYDKSEQSLVEIESPLHKEKSYTYSLGDIILTIHDDTILTKTRGQNKLKLYTKYNQLRKEIELDTYG